MSRRRKVYLVCSIARAGRAGSSSGSVSEVLADGCRPAVQFVYVVLPSSNR